MVLQHARAINRIDVLVWHNISNNIRNNPPQAQAPGRGRGRGRGRVDVGVGVGMVLDV
jgi:hypothetical protein